MKSMKLEDVEIEEIRVQTLKTSSNNSSYGADCGYVGGGCGCSCGK